MSKKKRSRGRMLIRRKVSTQPAQSPSALPEIADDTDDDGFGFVARNDTDFIGNEQLGDFVSDNELRLSDEIYALYAETLGERVAEQSKGTIESMAKLEDTLANL